MNESKEKIENTIKKLSSFFLCSLGFIVIVISFFVGVMNELKGSSQQIKYLGIDLTQIILFLIGFGLLLFGIFRSKHKVIGIIILVLAIAVPIFLLYFQHSRITSNLITNEALREYVA